MLVAHSYGGFVATNAATGNTNVKALVYIDGFMPEEGETLGGLAARAGSCIDASALNPVPYDGSGVEDDPVLVTHRDVGPRDPARAEEEMSSRAGADISRVKAGHLTPITRPADVTKVILSASGRNGRRAAVGEENALARSARRF